VRRRDFTGLDQRVQALDAHGRAAEAQGRLRGHGQGGEG